MVARGVSSIASSCVALPQLVTGHPSTLFLLHHGVPASITFCSCLTCTLFTKPQVTGYHAIATRFFREKGFQHVALLSADGALEAAPAMGCADIILDLISTGVTLRENNLKQIEGGRIMDSQVRK